MQQVAACRRLWLSGSLGQQRRQWILATAAPPRWQRQFCSSSKAGGEDEQGDEKGLKDRRPIAARGLAVFQGLADRLAARNVSPNTISMWSIGAGFAACACFAATPYLGTHINRVLVLHTRIDICVCCCAVLVAPAASPAALSLAWFGGAGGVQLRLMANLLDGMVAERLGVASSVANPLGLVYNDLPDRVSDIAILGGLGLALGGTICVHSSSVLQCRECVSRVPVLMLGCCVPRWVL